MLPVTGQKTAEELEERLHGAPNLLPEISSLDVQAVHQFQVLAETDFRAESRRVIRTGSKCGELRKKLTELSIFIG